MPRTMLATGYSLEANVNTSPLVAGIEAQSPALVGLLLYAGADPNEKPERKWAPVFEAVYAGNPEVLKLLLIFGADRHVVDSSGDLPLDEAVRQKNLT